MQLLDSKKEVWYSRPVVRTVEKREVLDKGHKRCISRRLSQGDVDL